MANCTTFTDRAREVFLKTLAETANVTASAKAAGVSRRTVYNRKKEDPAFAQEWSETIEEAIDALEAEARRRAIEGWEEPVFHQGKECGRVRKYSDRMLEILLKAHRPEKFKERAEVKHTFSLEDLVAGDE